jgi:hypothetical protein
VQHEWGTSKKSVAAEYLFHKTRFRFIFVPSPIRLQAIRLENSAVWGLLLNENRKLPATVMKEMFFVVYLSLSLKLQMIGRNAL